MDEALVRAFPVHHWARSTVVRRRDGCGASHKTPDAVTALVEVSNDQPAVRYNDRRQMGIAHRPSRGHSRVNGPTSFVSSLLESLPAKPAAPRKVAQPQYAGAEAAADAAPSSSMLLEGYRRRLGHPNVGGTIILRREPGPPHHGLATDDPPSQVGPEGRTHKGGIHGIDPSGPNCLRKVLGEAQTHSFAPAVGPRNDAGPARWPLLRSPRETR